MSALKTGKIGISVGNALQFNFFGESVKSKKRVLIRAPLLTVSGYGVHSRQIFEWLSTREDFDITVQVLKWGETSWMVNSNLENGLIGKIMEKSSPIEGTYDLSFQVQLPDEWDPSLAKFNVGITAGVETDVCNPAWISHINKMDLIIVPSQHVKKTFERTGEVKAPIVVIHESFHKAIASEDNTKLDLNIDTDFNFLVIGQLTGQDPACDRKNLFYTIKWLCEAFKDDPNVGIILKTNHGKNTRIDRELTKKLVGGLIKDIRPGEYPKIHLLHGHLTPEEISSIYTHPAVNCFVSLTRGEGFGLPLLEAAASGLPIIATEWSGHLDFLNHGKFIPVRYRLEPLPDARLDDRIFAKGSKWAEPIENDFKKNVKKFRNNYEIPERWAENLMYVIRDKFSHEAICKTYDKVINKACALGQESKN